MLYYLKCNPHATKSKQKQDAKYQVIIYFKPINNMGNSVEQLGENVEIIHT